MRVIREDRLVRRPWKNGGGTTAEIACWPGGSDLSGFGWRLSMADVASDGPFSSFPGVDRTLVLLRGAGLRLQVDGVAHAVDAARPAVSFPGDVPTTATLVAGPIRDFNVMTRREAFRHELTWVTSGRMAIESAAVLLAHAGPATISDGRRSHPLRLFDALQVERPAILEIDGPVLLVRLHGVPQPG